MADLQEGLVQKSELGLLACDSCVAWQIASARLYRQMGDDINEEVVVLRCAQASSNDTVLRTTSHPRWRKRTFVERVAL